MTTIGLPSRYSSDIEATRNNSFGGPTLFGCNAFTKNYPQGAKSYTDSTQDISSSSAVLPISTDLTNNDHPEERSCNMKPAIVKQENLKHAHGEVQSQFASMMAMALENQHGNELQCCITYSKPCGCIRKYILGGDKWKENSSLQLRNADEIDPTQVIENDKTMIGPMELERARELVGVYEHAAELKKEKCYAFNNVEVEGKSLKELRGMIGLGNGRKRSKKYEDYVLQMRSKLRNQYALCEKAAQKLLGYSINFLYKKLRTNPQKTSRLVATNKAERASKAPRHLIPLEELREMGRKANGTNQCCGRNCISRLASQHFDKIEDWRKRLEGSGQRVAQEIVAEVLRASSSSLDGQSSFCQNLVHWVTGCSFKKIRRVRDHLKKDPASLPEHGLKKYWKDKVKNKQKNEPSQKIPKTEKQDYTDPEMMRMDGGMYYYQNQLSSIQMQQQNFSLPYTTIPDGAYNAATGTTRPAHFTNSDVRDTTGSTQWPGTNLNNSNNMLMPARAYVDDVGENKPNIGVMQSGIHDRGTPDVNQVTNSGPFPNHTTQSHAAPGSYLPPDDQQFRMQQRRLMDSRQITASPYQQPPDASINMQTNQSYGQQPQQQQYSHVMKNQIAEDAGLQHHQGQAAARGSVILHTAGSQLQPAHQKQPPPYSQTATTGGNIEERNDAYHSNQLTNSGQNEMLGMAFNSHQMYGQHYYIAAANNGQESTNFFPGGVAQGLAPFVLSSGETENADDMKNGEYKQPFYILSPLPQVDKGFSATDLKNFQQLPLTPIQILQTPYLPSGKGFEQGGDGRQESQQFFFPMSVTNAEAFQSGEYDKSDGAQDLKNQNAAMQFPPGPQVLKSLAVVHGSNGIFNLGPWQMPNHVDGSGQVMHSQQPGSRTDSGQQWPVLALQQYPPNVNLDQVQNQPQIMYDASQFQSHQSQYVAGQIPANNDSWRKDELEKKNVHAADSVCKHPQGPPTSVAYQQSSMYEQGQSHSGKVSETKDNPEEEKDGGGIVTPNIIREALSNNFGAIVASSGVAGSLPVPVPELDSLSKKQVVETKVPPPLEMPKLDAVDPKDSEQSVNQTPKGDEERCAPINTRLKRFSRDRLRATIDSPNIVLTPYTPLTPSLTPAITIPDTSGDETAKENSASSTNSQNKGGDIFRFPPTHVSRRAAALRLQGQTVSDAKICKTKSPKDSPRTPGPFPVAAGSSPNPDKGEQADMEADNVGTSVTDKSKSPALTLRDLNQSSDTDKLTKDKMPVIGFDAANWQDGSTLPSPGIEPTDDTALNTPTQQPLNTPTSLNTPTQQLNTPNQDLKTPTESPVKSLHPHPGKRKLESPGDSSSQADDSSSSQSSVKSSGPAAKSLRFHCFTPKDFNDGNVNCSAFRKPSEFASTPTDSAIAQRRRKPRKQPHPSSLSTPEDENGQDIDMREVSTPENRDNEDGINDAAMDPDSMDKVNESAGSRESRSQMSAKASFSGIPRLGDGGIMLVGNPYDSQTPPFLQLITPSLFPASGNMPDPSGRQQTPFSTQQVNTPVFLHSATFLTPGGSGMLRKISPAAIQSGTSNTPQVFTFMPGVLPTSSKSLRTQETEKKVEDEQDAQCAVSSKSSSEEDKSKVKMSEKEAKLSNRVKQKPSTLPLSDIPPSPALTGKDGGLQTPSNLKVVTPSLAINSVGSVPASEQQQIFNFPSSGFPGLYPASGSAARTAPRYVLCTPSKTSPTGSILYHPCTSPSKAKGAMALVPIEMVSTPQKTTNQIHSPTTLNENVSKEHDKVTDKAMDKDNSSVPVIIVDSPKKGADDKEGDTKKPIEGKHSSDTTKPSERLNKVTTTSPEKKPAPTNAKSPTAKTKSSSSPKGLPKPLVMSHINTENPNVQTPTMIHLVSPSHHSPNSPLVFYPMTRPPLTHGQPGSKIQSPLSANSASGTPQLMVLQRFYGPGGSSSLLKSALMKSMPVFQFPPPVPPTSTGSNVVSHNDETASNVEVSNSPCSTSSSGEVMDTSPSAAVSVICGPRASGQRPPEQLANDPCLSESAQQ